MPEPDQHRSLTLSYLGAFTLGLVCMATVVLVVQDLNSGKAPTPAKGVEEMDVQTFESIPTNTFAHRARALGLPPRENVSVPKVRKTSSPPPRPAIQTE